jgi:ABC-type branched-subunit amino acid transport system substrate-binding protein
VAVVTETDSIKRAATPAFWRVSPPSEYSAQLVPYSVLDLDVLVRELHASQPEILVIAGTFEQETQIVRARPYMPASIQAIASVAAGVHAFRDELGHVAEGVIGPSQWEAHASFPADLGPDALWFVRNFRGQFGREPEYTAAGGFALGLIFGECLQRVGSLQDNNLLAAAAELDCYTFYGRFRLDSASRQQRHQSAAYHFVFVHGGRNFYLQMGISGS